MLSEVIQSELSYRALPLAGTALTPEVRSLRSSRTRSKSSQNSTPAVDRRPTCLTHLQFNSVRKNRKKIFHTFLCGLDCDLFFFKNANIQSLRALINYIEEPKSLKSSSAIHNGPTTRILTWNKLVDSQLLSRCLDIQSMHPLELWWDIKNKYSSI
jgi:hypothetical protein